MADQCIVCLGDLNHTDDAAAEAPEPTANYVSSQAAATESAGKLSIIAVSPLESELVAHLLPCGHDLHDECLKPWVERANSCPICRASFNMVELHRYVGGPVIDSYAVQNKQQVADLDTSMVVDDDLFGEADTPCMVCQVSNNEDELLLCDGCNQACHVACAGLDGIPGGAWFCYDCMSDPHILQNAVQGSIQHTEGTRRGRTVATRRTPRRRANARQRARSRDWAEVWSRIERRTGIDLDFPFDEESEDPMDEITRLLTRERDQRWQRRADVATRQGAGARFRAAAPAILQNMRPQQRPEPESQEELRAWNVFDKERQLREEREEAQSRAARSRRKRKSPSASPSEAQKQPEPRLKRPRTRRVQEVTGESSHTSGEPSAPTARGPDSEPSAPQPRRERSNGLIRPSFLQSLLQEVTTTPAPVASPDPGSPQFSDPPLYPLEQSLSPRPSSPELSPVSSGHVTPRSMTPVANSSPRPASPPLSSMISPVFPPAPEFSPFSPNESDSIERARARTRREPLDDSPRGGTRAPPTKHSRKHSPDHSPSRATLSYSTKLEIQRMVKNVLRPLYAEQKIDKDEYTEVNKNVSRVLYDKVADYPGGLEDENNRREWQRMAQDKVSDAIEELRKEVTAANKLDSNTTSIDGDMPVRTNGPVDSVASASQVEIKQEA